MLATYVIETVGTQEYQLGQEHFLVAARRRLRRRLGRRDRARWSPAGTADPRAHAPAAVPVRLRRRPGRTRGRTSSGSAPTSHRARCSRRTRVACSRWASAPPGRHRSAGGPRTRAGSCDRGTSTSVGRCGGRCGTSRSASTPTSRGWSPAARTRRGPVGGSRPRSSRPTPSCTGWAGRTRSRCCQDGRLVGGLYGIAIGGLFAGESMFHTATDASKAAVAGPGRHRGRRRRPATPGRRAVAHAAPGDAGRHGGAAVRVPTAAGRCPDRPAARTLPLTSPHVRTFRRTFRTSGAKGPHVRS